jgi:hypothetical protein
MGIARIARLATITIFPLALANTIKIEFAHPSAAPSLLYQISQILSHCPRICDVAKLKRTPFAGKVTRVNGDSADVEELI